MDLTSHSTGIQKSNIQPPEIQEQASRKADRAIAMNQMLQPYKLGEDYAQPAVPYKWPVL